MLQPSSRTRVFRAQGLCAAFGDKTVLDGLDLYLAQHSLCALVGASGSGKTVLLRTLSGANQANPRFRWQGTMEYDSQPWSPQWQPPLVQLTARTLMQRCREALLEAARPTAPVRSAVEWDAWLHSYVEALGFPELMAQADTPVMDMTPLLQQVVAILRAALTQPAVLLVDDLGTELDDYDTYLLLELLRKLTTRIAVVVVLRDPRHLRFCAHDVAVLENGQLQEVRRVEDFLCEPRSAAGQRFLREGDDAQHQMPGPGAALLAAQEAEPVQQEAVLAEAAAQSQRALRWLVSGQLGGMADPAPGHPWAAICQALHAEGVRAMVSLGTEPLERQMLASHGLQLLQLPVFKGEAPSVAQLHMLIKRLEGLQQHGGVAVHSPQGQGRCGVLLAAWLVHEGLTAEEALRRLQQHDARYVLTPAQKQQLQAYEEFILRHVAA